MAGIGAFYLILGLVLHIFYRPQTFEPSRSVLRAKKHFMFIGVFNIGLAIIVNLEAIELITAFALSGLSVAIGLLLVALEAFDTYRKILNRIAI